MKNQYNCTAHKGFSKLLDWIVIYVCTSVKIAFEQCVFFVQLCSFWKCKKEKVCVRIYISGKEVEKDPNRRPHCDNRKKQKHCLNLLEPYTNDEA